MNKNTLRNLNIVKGLLSIAFIAILVIASHSWVTSVRAYTNPTGNGTLVPVPPINTAISNDLHGWAWSDMPDGSDQSINPGNQEGGRGFGWISVNGTDPGTSGNYAVVMSPTGILSGYAWSGNGGWLDFSPSGPYPTFTSLITHGNAAPTTNARVTSICITNQGTSCSVTGWIRFVAGEDTNSQDTGGWDGWVDMSGTNFGVTYDANPADANYGKFSGYAWGGTDAGWINFDGVSITPTTVTMLTCQGIGIYAGTTYTYTAGSSIPIQCGGVVQNPNPTTASASLVQSNLVCSAGTVTLTWSSVNTTACTATTSGVSGIGGFSGSIPTSGSASISGIPQNGIPNNFTISCNAPGQTPPNPTATVSVMCPVVTNPNPNPGGGGTGGIPVPIYKEN